MSRRLAAWLIGVALAGKLLLLGLLMARGPETVLYVDSETYLGPARALLETGAYAPDPERPDRPELIRTPGYPVLLALVFRFLGERLWIVSALGALFSAATALALLVLYAKPFGERAAAWGAVLVSFEPGSFCRSLDILSETFFTLLLVLGLGALVALLVGPAPRAGRAFLGGLALAAATLVRPILAPLLPVLAFLLLVVSAKRRWAPGRGAAVLAAFLLAPVLLVGGWMARNERVAGAFSLVPVTGHQLLHRRAAAVLALVENVPLAEVQERLGIREAFFRFRGPGSETDLFGPRRYGDVFRETAHLDLFELDRRWTDEALRIFREHPAATAAVTGRGALQLLFTPPSLILSTHYGLVRPDAEVRRLYANQDLSALAGLLRSREPVFFAVSVLLVASLVILAACAVAGAVGSWRLGPRPVHAVLLVSLLWLIGASSSTDAMDDRYRVPLMPLVCLYAAAAVRPPSPVG
jgi:4-amino-4-deoxy-L-arabinose transferase-like glycosyltransferase